MGVGQVTNPYWKYLRYLTGRTEPGGGKVLLQTLQMQTAVPGLGDRAARAD